MMKDPRILYFLAGGFPTAADKVAVLSLGSNVSFRNGSVSLGGAAIEKCDAVSGVAIPPEYKGKPDGAETLAEHRAKLIAEAEAEMQNAEGAAKVERLIEAGDKKAQAAAQAAQAKAQAQAEAAAQAAASKAAAGAPVGTPAAAGWQSGK